MPEVEHSPITPTQSTVSKPSLEQRRNAVFTGRLNPIIKGAYSVALYDMQSNSVLDGTGLDPSDQRTRAEYFFTVPPKNHEFTEPFTTTVVPTQNGGKYIESHGSILKNLKIQGTTGIRPNPKVRSVSNIPLIGSAASTLLDNAETLIGSPPGRDSLLGSRHLAEDEVTGYDDIMFLRNIFRKYSDIKEHQNNAGSVVMLWRNYKDADYWVVEPIDFRLVQDSKSPLTYDYHIQFRVLTKFWVTITFEDDPLRNILSTQRFFARVQEYTQTLKRTFLILQTQVRRLEAAGVFATTQILNPVVDILSGLNTMKTSGMQFGQRIRRTAEALFENTRNAAEILASGNVDPQDLLVRTCRRLMITCARILTEPSLQENLSNASTERRDRAVQSYARSGDAANRARSMPRTGGSSTFLGNVSLTDNVQQDVVNPGETIRGLAYRLLGTAGQWQTLVVLNDLRAPYITPDGKEGTLKPGDPVYYPSSSGVLSQGIRSAEDLDVPAHQRIYKRDLRLRSVRVGDVEYTDLATGQNGDLASIAGISNVEQSLKVKFMTERGELPVHPKFGAKFAVGSKMTDFALNEFQIQTEATIFSDERVQDIRRLEFTAIEDILVVNASLTLQNSSDTVNTILPVRRL